MNSVWITGGERSIGLAVVKYILGEHRWDHFHIHSLGRTGDWPEGLSNFYCERVTFHQGWDLARLTARGMEQQLCEMASVYGLPSIVIHNAGITRIDWIEDMSYKDYREVMTVNADARWIINRTLIDLYKVRREALKPEERNDMSMRFVHVTSMGARYALRASSAYCMAKAADAMLVRALARDVTGRIPGLTFISVAPNSTADTAMIEQCVKELQRTRGMTEAAARAYNVQSPLGRLATLEETAKTICLATFEMPEYLTGGTIEMHGANPA